METKIDVLKALGDETRLRIDLPPEVVPVIMLVPSVKPWHSAVG
jgi:hypothetical protein